MSDSFAPLILATLAVLAALVVGTALCCYLDPVESALARAAAWGMP